MKNSVFFNAHIAMFLLIGSVFAVSCGKKSSPQSGSKNPQNKSEEKKDPLNGGEQGSLDGKGSTQNTIPENSNVEPVVTNGPNPVEPVAPVVKPELPELTQAIKDGFVANCTGCHFHDTYFKEDGFFSVDELKALNFKDINGNKISFAKNALQRMKANPDALPGTSPAYMPLLNDFSGANKDFLSNPIRVQMINWLENGKELQ